MITFLIVFSLIVYLLVAIPMYGMYRKAKTPAPWLAFIPIANLVGYFRVIRVSMWNFLWLLVPLVGEIFYFSLHNAVGLTVQLILLIPYLVMSIIWYVRLFKSFALNPLWLLILIGLIIPLIDLVSVVWLIVLLWKLGFGKNHPYQPLK